MAAWSKTLTCSCYELGHTWEPSCLKAVSEIALHGYLESFKIYAPLYVVTALIRRRDGAYYLKKLLPQVLQSTLFLGTNAFTFIGLFCLWRKIFGFYTFFNVIICGIPATALAFTIEEKQRRIIGRFYLISTSFIPAFCASYIAISCERKTRRGLLAVYMANVATETLFRMAVHRGMITPIKNGEVLLFSIVSAIYMFLFRTKNGLKEPTLRAIRILVGSSELPPSEKARNNNVKGTNSAERAVEAEGAESHTPLPRRSNTVLKSVSSARHRLCRHKNGCLPSVLYAAIRSFVLGYAIQAGIRLAQALTQVFKNPRLLLSAMGNTDNLGLGAFLGSFVGIFKAVNCLLRWSRDKDSNLHGMISGFLAGGSMMFYKSGSIALYLASKLVESLYLKGIDAGKLPYIKMADMFIYSVSTALVFHAAVFEVHNLRPAYWKFLLRLTNQRFAHMNRELLDGYGTEATKMFAGFHPKYDPRFTSLR